MNPTVRHNLFRAVALLALAACAGQAVGLLAGGDTCAAGQACAEVRESAWAAPLGLPLPLLGLTFFALLVALSLLPGERAVWALRGLAALGGLAGLGLVAVQALVLERFCPACLFVDALALVAALVSWWHAAPSSWAQGAFWLGLAGLAILGGALVEVVTGPVGQAWGRPPQQVLALRKPGKVTVVELIDWNCRRCRHVHWMLNHLQKQHPDLMYRVVIPVPPPAEPEAIRLLVSLARHEGLGEAGIQALRREMEPRGNGVEGAARLLGLSPGELKARLSSPDALAALQQEEAWVEEVGRGGLPAVWVQDTFFRGGASLERLQGAFQAAAASLPPGDQ